MRLCLRLKISLLFFKSLQNCAFSNRQFFFFFLRVTITVWDQMCKFSVRGANICATADIQVAWNCVCGVIYLLAQITVISGNKCFTPTHTPTPLETNISFVWGIALEKKKKKVDHMCGKSGGRNQSRGGAGGKEGVGRQEHLYPPRQVVLVFRAHTDSNIIYHARPAFA